VSASVLFLRREFEPHVLFEAALSEPLLDILERHASSLDLRLHLLVVPTGALAGVRNPYTF